MLKSLSHFDNRTSSGILARTALYLNDNLSNSLLSNVANEDEVRVELLKEISQILHVNEDEKDKIIDFIDNELNKDDVDIDENFVLNRLSNQADLPSDLFQVNVLPEIKNVYHNTSSDLCLKIEQTIKFPNAEYHFVNDGHGNPGNISLFLKNYKGDYPFNDFNLLVVGERKGIQFIVRQAWKLYNEHFHLGKNTNLVELLEDFADKFGVEITFRDQKAKFFLSQIAKGDNEFKFHIHGKQLVKDKKGKTSCTLMHFTENISDSDKKMSLCFAIDLNKYFGYLHRHDKTIKKQLLKS